jgi:hypothetical protein
MKKSILVLSIVSVSFIGYGIFSLTSSTKSVEQKVVSVNQKPTLSGTNKNNNDTNTLTINSECSVLKGYMDINSLFKDSNFVIQGKVVSTQQFYQDSNIYTDTVIQVLDDYTNNVGAGKNINVTFRGGTIEGVAAKEFATNMYKEKFGKEPNNNLPDRVTQNINSLENVTEGDTLILFLQDKSQYSPKDKYVLTGAYQGRFKIKNQSVELHDDLTNSAKTIKLSTDGKGFDKNDFIKQIKESKLQK